MAAGRHEDPATERGVRWLISEQSEDGTWEELEFTGTGFPRVFYLRYHMYRIYFPADGAVALGHRDGLEAGRQLGHDAADRRAEHVASKRNANKHGDTETLRKREEIVALPQIDFFL